MSRRFDKRTNVFNQNGRINQIEYAIKAIKNSGSALAFQYNNGILLCTEKQTSSSLLVSSKNGEKIFKVDDHIYAIVSGLTSDGNYLIEYLRKEGQNHKFTFDSPIALEVLVDKLGSYMQSYTQYGGMRPFGSSFLIVGYDIHSGLQIFSVDPSGNFAKWRAIAQGSNEETINNLLQEHFEENMTQEQALKFQMKLAIKALDSIDPPIEKLVIAYLEVKDIDEGSVSIKFLTDSQKRELVSTVKNLPAL